jgi:hypothetical protein
MTSLRMAAALTGIVAWSVAAGGCLQKEVAQRWYLELDGSLTWQVLEADVRSDAGAVADRQSEELTYISTVRNQSHAVALGLGRLGSVSTETRILRRTVPFTVVTSAQFTNLGARGEQALAAAGTAGTSTLEGTAGGLTWTLTILDVNAESTSGQDDEGLASLLDGFEKLNVVLATGRFTAAEGFQLSSDKRVATANWEEQIGFKDAGPHTLVLSLSWTGQ